MNTGRFVVEIGCEDLPDWAGPHFEEEWFPAFRAELAARRVAVERLTFAHTCRRIVFLGAGCAARQADAETEVTGPPVSAAFGADGAPTPAAVRFARANGAEPGDLAVREKKGKKVVAVVRRENGRPVEEVLGDALSASFQKVRIPRGMRWDRAGSPFVRPIRWVLALWNDRVLDWSFLGVAAGGTTRGHRVLAPEPAAVGGAEDYPAALSERFVLLDPAERRAALGRLIAAVLPPGAAPDAGALDRISRLVECPRAAAGTVPERYRAIPGEVVCAVVRKLKAVPAFLPDGSLSDRFALVFDGVESDAIRGNYEKVLGDRLEDARFFIEQDGRRSLSSFGSALQRVSHHPRWGTVADRVARLARIFDGAGGSLLPEAADATAAREAIGLCKNDLATLMVAEFPDLQGVIGRIYALRDGVDPAVAAIVEQHYWPRFPGDRVPESAAGAAVSLMDRMETLCGFLLDGAELSGSADPYGLRRMATGIVDTVWKRGMDVSLRPLVERTIGVFEGGAGVSADTVLQFLFQRADSLLAAEGVSAGVRRAVLAVEKENLLALRRKVDALAEFLAAEGGSEILTPFTRVANILRQAAGAGGPAGAFSDALLAEEAERALHAFALPRSGALAEACRRGDYARFLALMKEWREPVDRFFTDVLVMAPDEAVRRNRLALLSSINAVFLLFGDFSHISAEDSRHA